MDVSYEQIQKAHALLKPVIKRTETDWSRSASKLLGTKIFFKFENEQLTGSFKIRGAYNKLANLTEDEKKRGVIACSAGNHAQGVAMSASLAGVKSVIVMPESAPINKVEATKAYGSQVIFKGEIFDEAKEYANELARQHNYTFVHPYEDPFVIAGQGTIGIEILESVSSLDTIIVPIGGGGLISGIAIAAKKIKPNIKIIGVQSSQAPGMSQLFHHQNPEPSKKRISTIADGIAIKSPSQVMYESFISKYVDEVVTVTDDEIAEAIAFLMERAKTVTEGSGAAAMAAAMNRKVNLGSQCCIVLSGGNIDLNVVAKVIERGQIKRGRLAALSVVVDDLPGSLSRLTQAIAQQRANVLEVHHDRVSQGLYLRETRIDFVLETASPDHIQKIRTALEEAGGRIVE